jgi:hypothetical protein
VIVGRFPVAAGGHPRTDRTRPLRSLEARMQQAAPPLPTETMEGVQREIAAVKAGISR